MNDIIKVFDIGTHVKENVIDENQRRNIVNLFEELGKETHLITNCYLNENEEEYKKVQYIILMSPIKKMILIIKKLLKICYKLNVKLIIVEIPQYVKVYYL